MRKMIGMAAVAAGLAVAAMGGRAEVEAATPPAVHTVRMVMEGNAARFVPERLTIKAGDQVRFVNVSGGPHNVSLDPAKVPDDVERVLAASMADQIQPLWGALVTEPNGVYTISFAGVKPGTYEIFCMPHMTMGMKGTITVQ